MDDLICAMQASGLLQDLIMEGCEPTEIQYMIDYAYLTMPKSEEELI